MSLHVVMAGSSGFLGTHLRKELARRGHRVTALVRRPVDLPDESRWDPDAGDVDERLVASADVVVNLAGSPTIGNPHSRKWSAALHGSRVNTTTVLAEAIAAAPEPPYFVAGNAVAWYGDHGPAELTEAADSRGHSLMTDVCRDWQAAAQPTVDAGGRVVFLRDWVGATSYLVEHPTAEGPMNLCCVSTPTNEEFTEALAKRLHRPSIATVPAPVLKMAAGRLAPEVLGSLNVRPQALLDLGYEFADPDVDAVLASGLS